MNDREMIFDRKNIRPWIAIFAVLAVTPVLLRLEGRTWWCSCGSYGIWSGEIWSQHNSQHFLDPYSFTHILHGVLFYGILACLIPKAPVMWRLCIATGLEALWELLENSQLIIDRYRESTMALGYNGDSIFNSTGDLFSCAAGFLIARYLGLRYSILMFIVIEIVLLFWIRDNLTLNIVMLICPIEAVKNWQIMH